MKNLILFGIISIILVSSCKKNEDLAEPNPVNNPAPDYMPLKIGNYWIYDHYNIDTLGNETITQTGDSIVVDRDTVIGGNTYYILEGNIHFTSALNWGIVNILRDSADCIVDNEGRTLFSSENFTDVLHEYTIINQSNDDTIQVQTYAMGEVPDLVSVPAGTFDVLNYKGTVTSHYSNPMLPNPRYLNCYYASGVGKILSTYFYSSQPDYYERRLVRYHIEE